MCRVYGKDKPYIRLCYRAGRLTGMKILVKGTQDQAKDYLSKRGGHISVRGVTSSIVITDEANLVPQNLGYEKTSEALMKSAMSGVPIHCANTEAAFLIMLQAKRLGISIPDPIIAKPREENSQYGTDNQD